MKYCLAEYVLFRQAVCTRELHDLLHRLKFPIVTSPGDTGRCVQQLGSHTTNLYIDTGNHLQVQRRVPVDVDSVWLHVKLALQEEADHLMMTEAGAEVERNVIFVVLGIHWERKGRGYKSDPVLWVV